VATQRRKQKLGQADVVVRIDIPHDDPKAAMSSIERGQREAVEGLDSVNARRKGKQRLVPPIDLAFLDAAGNKVAVFPGDRRIEPQMYFEKSLDDSSLPNFAFVVATDARGNRLVARIEFERKVVQ